MQEDAATEGERLARVQVELAARAADATPLGDLMATTRDLTSVAPLLAEVAERVAELLGTDKAVVWVADPSLTELYPAAWLGLPDDYVGPMRVPYGTASAGRAVVEKQAVLVGDVATSEHYGAFKEQALEHGVRAAFSTPMLTGTGEAMGALTGYFESGYDPAPRERQLLLTLARQVAEIVERARMHAEARELAELEQRRSHQLRALADAALALSSADSLDELLRLVTEAARDIIGAHRGETSRLPHGQVDATTYVSPPGPPPLPGTFAAPLVGRGGGNLGQVQLSHKVDGTPFSAEDEAILVQLAQMASSTIDGLEALARERAARREAEAGALAQAVLSQASASFAASLDPQDVADLLVDVAVPGLADLAVLHVLDEERRRITLAALQTVEPSHREEALAFFAGFEVTGDQPYGAGKVIATGASELLAELTRDVLLAVTGDPQVADRLQAVVRRSGIIVPLVARGQTLGALSISRDEPYSDREVAYATDLANRAALALDTARRYAFERSVADALQRSLLPRAIPVVPLLSSASRYLPGARGTQIGGDWYDLIELDDGAVFLVVGDVMGRGVQAAVVMGQLRATVRAYAFEGHGPSEVLQRLDRVVLALPELDFTTCVIVRLDPASGTLCLASAGHLPPMVVAADGGGSLLELDPGLPLGVGGATYVEQAHELGRGEALLLYTDGLVEGPGCSVDEGLAQLVEAVSEPVSSADEVCDRVLRALRHTGSADSDDDTALLAILLDELGATAPLELDLPAQPASAHAARRALADLLAAATAAPSDIAALLVTELVANASRHAGGDVRLRAGLRAGKLRVEVCDSSPRLPVVVTSDDWTRESGRGMALVESLADRWGAEVVPSGKRVWFELTVRS